MWKSFRGVLRLDGVRLAWPFLSAVPRGGLWFAARCLEVVAHGERGLWFCSLAAIRAGEPIAP